MNDDNQSIEDFIKLLQKWYNNNYQDFASNYDAAVKNVQAIPEGTDPAVIHDWKDATIDDLCDFFLAWYTWNPDVSTGLQFIQRFSWLYYLNEQGRFFVSNDPGRLMTKYFVEINGRKMDSADSLPLVEKWMEELGSLMDDYIIPPGGYKNFNHFFAREIKPGKRPISSPDDDSVVVSPADAIVNMIDNDLTLDTKLVCKTQKLSISELLNHSDLAENFVGGSAVSCILMPNVYHRYHSPVGGDVVEADQDVAGNYFGIDNFPELINGGNVGYGYDYSVFEHFRRGYLIIKTEKFGYVGMVPVGLNTIASVIFHEPYKKVSAQNPVAIKKGAEIGYFQYGGSLNILLFEKGCFPSVRIPQGQVIGTLNEKPSDAQEHKQTQFIF